MKTPKEIDVLFIVPPFYRFIGQRSEAFHLGFGYLVSSLKQYGITSLIYDSDYSSLPSESGNFAKLENILRKILEKKSIKS